MAVAQAVPAIAKVMSPVVGKCFIERLPRFRAFETRGGGILERRWRVAAEPLVAREHRPACTRIAGFFGTAAIARRGFFNYV